MLSGKKILVFQDPMSELKKEGIAKLIKKHCDAIYPTEMWQVRFLKVSLDGELVPSFGEPIVLRIVKPKNLI